MIEQIESLLSDEPSSLKYSEGLIVQITLELGLRSIQLHAINRSDFKVLGDNEKYYSLDILNVKKIASDDYSKRRTAISSKLGNRIDRYLKEQNTASYLSDNNPLFMETDGKRISTKKVSQIVNRIIKFTGFDTAQFPGNSILRHNLAQALADQGSPAEIIGEILGHNSTVPARAYIAATPKIAEIKTRALGKSERFKDVLEMLRTGEPIKKDEVAEERWVQGIVGNVYIGGIGSCGLPSHTPCPKNPVYSCYTCQKFHPFRDGPHNDVLERLRNEAQVFIENSLNSGDFRFNRTLGQLELTIESVERTVNLFKIDQNAH